MGLDVLNPHVLTALIIGSGMLVAGVMAWLIKRHRKKLQGLRNAELLEPGPIALFLRPYFSDTKIKLLNPFFSFWPTVLAGISMDDAFLLPEQFVGRVLEPFINVVQVGGSPASIRNATLTVPEEEWRTLVAEAAHEVSVVVILPVLRDEKRTEDSSGKATIEELEYLVKSTLITRTIVIMPGVIWHSRKKIARGWEQARKKAAEFGLFLPAYDKKGAVITFEQKGETWRVSKIFGQGICSRRKIAFGLVEAVKWLAQRNSFALLDR